MRCDNSEQIIYMCYIHIFFHAYLFVLYHMSHINYRTTARMIKTQVKKIQRMMVLVMSVITAQMQTTLIRRIQMVMLKAMYVMRMMIMMENVSLRY